MVSLSQCLWSVLRGCRCPCECIQIGWPTRSQRFQNCQGQHERSSQGERVGRQTHPLRKVRGPQHKGARGKGWVVSGLQIPAGCLPDLQYNPAPRQLASPSLATSLLKKGDSVAFSSILRSRLGIVGNWVNFQTCSVEGKDQYPRATCS